MVCDWTKHGRWLLFQNSGLFQMKQDANVMVEPCFLEKTHKTGILVRIVLLGEDKKQKQECISHWT